jgi:regulator of protease activity HflC (stomatin/prohibitin superfamily)
MPPPKGKANAIAVIVFLVLFGTGCGLSAAFGNVLCGVVGFIVALLASMSIKIAAQWERVIVLRLGKYHRMAGPGFFFIIPVLENISHWIDIRVIATDCKAEQTLTMDNVPVDVDAIIFWKVFDPEKAALEVENYQVAISLASQTALRDIIGKTTLSEMLVGREKIDDMLRQRIDDRSDPWGISVQSVEIRAVLIPADLQKAMSMQAQAEREKEARVLLGESERLIAVKFEDAAKTYAKNPTALHLRAMNMLYEGLKEKATILIVPSTATDTMNIGAMAGLTALAKITGQELEKEGQAKKEKGE